MKKNNRRIINFSVLVLCLALIMFGVYAVSKKATLNINGTVGLIVHDCSVAISATIQGDAVFTSVNDDGETVYTMHPDGKESPERTLFDTVYLREEQSEKFIELKDPYYFTDLTADGYPKDILIKFEIQNLSTFKITAEVNMPVLSERLDDNEEGTQPFTLKTQTSVFNGMWDNNTSSKIKLNPEEIGYLYVIFQLDSTMVNGQIDYLTLPNLIDYDTVLNFRKFNTIKYEDGLEILEIGEYTKDGVTKPVKWEPVFYQDTFGGAKQRIPASGISSLNGKYITFAMTEIFETRIFSDNDLFESQEDVAFHPNSLLHEYLTSLEGDCFKNNYNISSDIIEYYNIVDSCETNKGLHFNILGYNEVTLLNENVVLNAFTGQPQEYWLNGTYQQWGIPYCAYMTRGGSVSYKTTYGSDVSGLRACFTCIYES